jgi:hypothetical protein
MVLIRASNPACATLIDDIETRIATGYDPTPTEFIPGIGHKMDDSDERKAMKTELFQAFIALCVETVDEDFTGIPNAVPIAGVVKNIVEYK